MSNFVLNGKIVWIGVVAVFAVCLVFTFTDALGASTSDTSFDSRYSGTCAHKHNGFDCKTPKYRLDISELQEKISDLELRIIQLERSR